MPAHVQIQLGFTISGIILFLIFIPARALYEKAKLSFPIDAELRDILGITIGRRYRSNRGGFEPAFGPRSSFRRTFASQLAV
jgi:hypothetical protein